MQDGVKAYNMGALNGVSVNVTSSLVFVCSPCGLTESSYDVSVSHRGQNPGSKTQVSAKRTLRFPVAKYKSIPLRRLTV